MRFGGRARLLAEGACVKGRDRTFTSCRCAVGIGVSRQTTHPFRPQSCVARRELIEKIQSGDFTVGEKIPTELELIEQFEVSRSVIREAITELRSLGYVETRHGIGTFVKEHSIEQNFLLSNASLETINDIVALLELRISLESEAVFLASERRKQVHIDQMKAALNDFEMHISSGENDGTVKADYDFHIAIDRKSVV